LKPPVGNRCIFEGDDFIVMVVGGPNSRKDYHWDEGEELFYQIKGDIKVLVQDSGAVKEIIVHEGEVFLLPARVPHNPVRGADTIGIVIERKRKEGELDGLLWFCENCNEKLYEEYFQLEDITTQFQGVFKRFYDSIELRTCKKCGTVMQPPQVAA
ncbi:MAG TPA: 3-hydroxyanthranilate 3,4-dioxygenase, partial [Pyrinomonadaceae bacterium]|nr:3-hydroxyanthranilate 3,4-dioxygenase [Pyrinomonadaceae bacterium]